MTESVISRFAPSPTGRLHLGHAFSAIMAHDLARSRGGAFRLRIEDIDRTRCRLEYIDGIYEDLHWLGIAWDGEPVLQSERLPLYGAALDRLKEARLVYPCFCTRRQIVTEIAASISAPHGPDGPLYPGTCRHLMEKDRAQRLAQGEAHAWRLDVAKAMARASALEWHDALSGKLAATPEIHGDVILARKDAPTSYHLAVVVDDAAQGVTDIVRGEDLFAATHIHRLLQALLGLPAPRYHHHRLLTDGHGQRLAKRQGAPSLQSMREEGMDPDVLKADLRRGNTDTLL